jgi:hypothetical protein
VIAGEMVTALALTPDYLPVSSDGAAHAAKAVSTLL